MPQGHDEGDREDTMPAPTKVRLRITAATVVPKVAWGGALMGG